jgi:hypothetical protein
MTQATMTRMTETDLEETTICLTRLPRKHKCTICSTRLHATTSTVPVLLPYRFFVSQIQAAMQTYIIENTTILYKTNISLLVTKQLTQRRLHSTVLM